MTNEQTPETRTAAEVLLDAMDERGIGSVLEDDASEMLDALADAGYTIAGPGQVTISRERWERVRRGAEHGYRSCMSKYDGWMCKYPEIQPGDLDPLPTREGE
jgi:hypothetical protein